MVVDVVVRIPQKSNVYEYEKNMYVVTPRCDAAAAVVSAVMLRRMRKEYTHPYSIERVHAPVLHDASQIAYCRY